MKHDWIRSLRIACVCATLLAMTLSVAGTPPAQAAPRTRAASTLRADASSGSKRAGNALRQFTGYVTSMDGTSVTVEKRGKKPESRTFTKHDELRTTGDVAKDARVTVFYRDENGKSIAHRIVAKTAKAASTRSRG